MASGTRSVFITTLFKIEDISCHWNLSWHCRSIWPFCLAFLHRKIQMLTCVSATACCILSQRYWTLAETFAYLAVGCLGTCAVLQSVSIIVGSKIQAKKRFASNLVVQEVQDTFTPSTFTLMVGGGCHAPNSFNGCPQYMYHHRCLIWGGRALMSLHSTGPPVTAVHSTTIIFPLGVDSTSST